MSDFKVLSLSVHVCNLRNDDPSTASKDRHFYDMTWSCGKAGMADRICFAGQRDTSKGPCYEMHSTASSTSRVRLVTSDGGPSMNNGL